MSTTATNTTRTKTRAKGESRGKVSGEGEGGDLKSRRAKRDTSEKRKAANKRNAQKSTGPRTPEGKGKSKYNAVTHGLTARSTLLPGDDAGKLAELRREMIDDLQPRNSLEATLILRIADDKWISDRSEEAADRRLAMRLRHEPLEQAQKERDEALELGEHLFWNLARPLPVDASTERVSLGEPPLAEVAVHPSHPARVCLRLEQTVAGCDWLLSRWDDLNQRLGVENVWLASDAFKMVRLLGKHAVDMDEDFAVARLLMSSLTMIQSLQGVAVPQPSNWALELTRMLAESDFEGCDYSINLLLRQFSAFTHRLARLPLTRMAPESVDRARDWLTAVITREFQRIHQIRSRLKEIAEADAADARARLWFETGPEGENHRRYLLSNKRVLNRSIGTFLNARKQSESGAFDPRGGGAEDGETTTNEREEDFALLEAASRDAVNGAGPDTIARSCEADLPVEPRGHVAAPQPRRCGQTLRHFDSRALACTPGEFPSRALPVGIPQSLVLGPLAAAAAVSPGGPRQAFSGPAASRFGEPAICDLVQISRNEAISRATASVGRPYDHLFEDWISSTRQPNPLLYTIRSV